MVETIKIEVALHDLVKVLNQTGNPEIAAHVLNGTYQEPEFDKSDKAYYRDKTSKPMKMVYLKYNIWTDEVTCYSGSFQKTMPRKEWEDMSIWESDVHEQTDE